MWLDKVEFVKIKILINLLGVAMKKIVFLDRATFPHHFTVTKPDFPHVWQEHINTEKETVLERVKDAHIVITNKVPLDADVIANCPQLELIAVTATGYNIVDIAACQAHNVTVSNVSGYAKHTVAEHVFMLILALQKSLSQYEKAVAAGQWQQSDIFCFFDYKLRGLAGKTLAIIGGGDIGSQVARIAGAFDMNVLFASARKNAPLKSGYVSLDEVYANADIISLHCPLTPETKDLLTLEIYQKMAKKPLIINTARGGIANEADTVTALDMELIAGIGFDCLTTEPPTADNPLLQIVSRDNVIITPHIGWANEEAVDTVWQVSLENIEKFIAGTPQNVVS